MRILKDAPIIHVDTEGTLNHPFSETWGSSFSVDGQAAYLPFNHMIGDNLQERHLAAYREVIENARCLDFHNAKHDLRAFRNLGINYKGPFYDTMLMAHMNNENYYSKELDALGKLLVGRGKAKSEAMDAIIKGFGWPFVPAGMMNHYACEDSLLLEDIFNVLLPDFQSQGFDGPLWEWEQKLVRMLMDVEDHGILVDQELSEREYDRGTKIMAEIERELGFNPGSPAQVGNFLINELDLPVLAWTKGGKTGKVKPSFNKEAMQQYDEILAHRNDKRAKMILTYRGWQKTTGSNYKSYLEKLGPDGRIRCNYKIHGTKTCRLSCEDPNLQQIPKQSGNDWNGKLKSAFITEPGRTRWGFDYSQVEFRLGAAYGKEKKLLEVFDDPSRDIFEEIAKDLGMERDPVKTLNYTLQFGGRARRISNVFGVSIARANEIIDNYYNEYSGLKRASELAEQRAQERGYIQYWSGRRRHFQFDSEYRKAFNAACQGGAWEIIKRRGISVWEAGLSNDECKMDLLVHDELCFDIEDGKEDEYIPEIVNILENPPENFGVKFRVKYKKWGT